MNKENKLNKENKFLIPIGRDDEKYFDILEKYKKYIGGVYIAWPGAPSARTVLNTKAFFDKIYKWCIENDKVFDILLNMQAHNFENGFKYNEIDIEKYTYSKVEITFASILLFKEKKFTIFKKNISANFRLSKQQQLYQLNNELKKINSIVIDRDINRDYEEIKKILKTAKRLSIDCDIMLNEGCMPFCSNRMDHNIFITLNFFSDQNKWMNKSKQVCTVFYKKIENILKSSFIPEENLRYYDCRFFKVVCRQKPINELKEILDYYIYKKPVDLGSAFTNIDFMSGIKTDILNEVFCKKILDCKNNCFECNFCDEYYKKLFS